MDYKDIKPVNPKGNQSYILLEGLMLKFQHFGYLMSRIDSIEKKKKKPLILGKIEDRRRTGWQRMRWLDGKELVMGSLACWGPWGHKESDTTEQLNWTELALNLPLIPLITLKRSLVFPILLFSSVSFHCSLRKAFLSLFTILWNSSFSWVYLSFSPLPFTSLLFSAICKALSDNHFAFLHLFFGW